MVVTIGIYIYIYVCVCVRMGNGEESLYLLYTYIYTYIYICVCVYHIYIFLYMYIFLFIRYILIYYDMAPCNRNRWRLEVLPPYILGLCKGSTSILGPWNGNFHGETQVKTSFQRSQRIKINRIGYPLVMTHVAIWLMWLVNMTIEIVDLPMEKWWFSTVVLVYRQANIAMGNHSFHGYINYK